MAIAISNFFQGRRNQFAKRTLQVLFRANPYQALYDREEFDLEAGITPTIRTLTHELPTAYPTNASLTAMGDLGTNQVSTAGLSNGTLNPYGQDAITGAVTIKRGEVQRAWFLYQTAFKTDVINMSDLKRAVDAANAVGHFEKALREYMTVWWSDWSRVQAQAMVSNKATVVDATTLTVSTGNTDVDHHGVSVVPGDFLNWAHLDIVYMNLCRAGVAEEYSIGTTESGMPVFPLILSPGYKMRLFRDETDKREQIKFSQMGSGQLSNLKALGYDKAINGWLPIVDLFPIRYAKATAITLTSDLTFTNVAYPTVNGAAATSGRTYSNNPNYLPRTKGGQADFEVINILPRNVFVAQFEPSGPDAFSGMKYDPQSYVGEFSWVNNKTFNGDNDLGDLGYYATKIRVGAKPLFPQFGYSIVAKVPSI